MGKFAVLVLLVCSGCGYTITNTKDPPARKTLSAEELQAAELATIKESQEERARIQARNDEFLTRQRAGRVERREQQEKEKAEALETKCSPGRRAREAEMQRLIAERDRRAELVSWEVEHCAWEDHAKEVVRARQTSRGEIYFVQKPDRDVERVCDAKPPKELDGHWSRFLPQPHSELDTEIMVCRNADEAASAMGRLYWRK